VQKGPAEDRKPFLNSGSPDGFDPINLDRNQFFPKLLNTSRGSERIELLKYQRTGLNRLIHPAGLVESTVRLSGIISSLKNLLSGHKDFA